MPQMIELQDDEVVIKKARLADLEECVDDSRFLHALRAAGVDNWGGYENAQDIIAEWDTETSNHE